MASKMQFAFRVCFSALVMLLAPPVLAAGPGEIRLPGKMPGKMKSFEPSAVLYLEDLGSYLIASDDTDKSGTPYLFLMSEKGKVAKQPLLIEGLDAITDMESMSQDGDYLYVMSSQGLNKKGKEQPERAVFVRTRRKGASLVADGEVSLRNLLLDAWKRSRDPGLRALRGRVEEELNIESHFIMNGELYVGLKSPQPAPGQALVLALGNVDSLFSRGSLAKAEAWRTVDFRAISGGADMLSDIALAPGRLLLSSSEEGGTGRLWSMDLASGELALEAELGHDKPEGVAYRHDEAAAMVVFDRGKEGNGLYELVPLSAGHY